MAKLNGIAGSVVSSLEVAAKWKKKTWARGRSVERDERGGRGNGEGVQRGEEGKRDGGARSATPANRAEIKRISCLDLKMADARR